jgi:Tfp pilus assembly protein FimT
MNQTMNKRNFSRRVRDKRQAGVTILDALITLAVIGVVTSFAVVGINSARNNMNLSNSAQILSAYMEKARLAAIRCHCPTTLQIGSTGTFAVTAPLKSATSETLTLPLASGVTFQGVTIPTTITFDWRGRPDNDYHLTLTNQVNTKRVDLSGGGDVRLDSESNYTYAPTIQANMPTNLSDGAADSYVTAFANNNSNNSNNSNVTNPKNHKKPKK